MLCSKQGGDGNGDGERLREGGNDGESRREKVPVTEDEARAAIIRSGLITPALKGEAHSFSAPHAPRR